MAPDDKKKFISAIVGAAQITGHHLGKSAIELYWRLLEDKNIADVITAIKLHLLDPDRGRFMPKPADIVFAIDAAMKERLGIPDIDTAYQQAFGVLPMTHPIVWHAQQKAKLYDAAYCQREGNHANRKRFETVFQSLLKEMAAGNDMRLPEHLKDKYPQLVNTVLQFPGSGK